MMTGLKLYFPMKLVCLAAFLWASLCPPLHQLYHLSFQDTSDQCFHQNDHQVGLDNDELNGACERNDQASQCVLCLIAVNSQMLWLIEGQPNSILTTFTVTIEPDGGEQALNQTCKIGYKARAGPRVS